MPAPLGARPLAQDVQDQRPNKGVAQIAEEIYARLEAERSALFDWGGAVIRAALIGRLGADRIRRETRNGGVMATGSVLVDVSRPDEDAASEWIGIVAFGNAADTLLRHKKGDLISAMGALSRSTYADKNDELRQSWSLAAETLPSARTTYDNDAPARPRRAPAIRGRTPYRGKRPAERTADLPADPVDDLFVP